MSAPEIYEVLGILALGAAAVLGVFLASLQLPGTWLILGAAAVYDWLHDWQRIGPAPLAVLGGLTILAEVVEQVGSALFSWRAGGSRRASWGGLIGGLAGMVVFTLPVPVLGTIAGGVIGCFVGAVIGELSVRDDLRHGAHVGVAAAMGRIAGILVKLMVAFVIVAVVMCCALLDRR